MTPPADLAALEELLRELFPDPGELRRFVARIPDCGDLPDQIPGDGVSPDALRRSVAAGLDARGLLDDRLFRQLYAARQGQVAAIDAVARRFPRSFAWRPWRAVAVLAAVMLIACAAVALWPVKTNEQPGETRPPAVAADPPAGKSPERPAAPAIEINYGSKNEVQAGPNSKVEIVGVKSGE